ncbi:hypothetical protein HK105_205156 [Polyrhizophydium stewartii]|uniref:Zn(2)-C6 fungal-type domain-containing protein n=1 Tax=Polyrhizophydium stewartii TaxID=2732419 RepID=A0ABR4N6Z2_9FUNG
MRPNHTCGNCIRRKKRCDRARPTCGQCLAKGAVCVYPAVRPASTFPPLPLLHATAAASGIRKRRPGHSRTPSGSAAPASAATTGSLDSAMSESDAQDSDEALSGNGQDEDYQDDYEQASVGDSELMSDHHGPSGGRADPGDSRADSVAERQRRQQRLAFDTQLVAAVSQHRQQLASSELSLADVPRAECTGAAAGDAGQRPQAGSAQANEIGGMPLPGPNELAPAREIGAEDSNALMALLSQMALSTNNKVRLMLMQSPAHKLRPEAVVVFEAMIAPHLLLFPASYLLERLEECPLVSQAIVAMVLGVSPNKSLDWVPYYEAALSSIGAVLSAPTPLGVVGLLILCLAVFRE